MMEQYDSDETYCSIGEVAMKKNHIIKPTVRRSSPRLQNKSESQSMIDIFSTDESDSEPKPKKKRIGKSKDKVENLLLKLTRCKDLCKVLIDLSTYHSLLLNNLSLRLDKFQEAKRRALNKSKARKRQPPKDKVKNETTANTDKGPMNKPSTEIFKENNNNNTQLVEASIKYVECNYNQGDTVNDDFNNNVNVCDMQNQNTAVNVDQTLVEFPHVTYFNLDTQKCVVDTQNINSDFWSNPKAKIPMSWWDDFNNW